MKTPTEIIITLEPNGESATETRGFRGGACRKEAAPYRALLGTVDADNTTAEGCLPEINPVGQRVTLRA